MSTSWSETEVFDTIEAYFKMLRLELAGSSYNKSEHRRALLQKLNKRTEGAIERKHQNISAVLIQLGIPYINGYKPLGNYQSILLDGIEHYLKSNPDFKKVLDKNVDEKIIIPTVDDILSALVEPPESPQKPSKKISEDPQTPYLSEINYLEREEQNIFVGSAGEQFVINYEKARLILAGKNNLADRIEHVAETIGPVAGYDILSFELDGSDRYIEAKATKYGKYTPFFFSKNELRFSEEHNDKYFLYRVFQIAKEPKLFHLKGSLRNNFDIEPFSYVGRVIRL